MTDLQKVVAFRNLLRSDLPEILQGYKLIFDNADFEGDKARIFKLIFSGAKMLQISNSDWRDYLEYFDFHVDGNEIFSLNINDYHTLQIAFEALTTQIRNVI